MRTSLRHIVFQGLLAAVAASANAGNVVCNGLVEALAYHQPGNLMLRLSSMNLPVFICSTDVVWSPAGSLAGSTSPAARKTLYATFLAAKLARTPINNLYLDGDQVPASCTAFEAWATVNVRYFDY